MKHGTLRRAAFAAVVLLAGCGGGREQPEPPVRQTGLPGMVTAGGSTSGEVMALAGGVNQPSPEGTPGIPQGADGNTSGTQMGGTALAREAVQPASNADSPLSAAERARREQAALEAAMERVAALWQRRAAEQGWQLTPPPEHAASAAQVRSSKLGTAPPSQDVKQAIQVPTDPGVGAEAPDAVQPGEGNRDPVKP